jgi:hypothetical protein
VKERKEFPREKDFKEGLVYFDKEKAEEVKRLLETENGRCCLLTGPPASRKTTFGLCLGFYLKNEGYSVYYLKIEKQGSYENLFQIVKPYINEGRVIFIIDDCQNSPNDIGKFAKNVASQGKAKFLFISRKISQFEFIDPEYDYFKNLEKIIWLEKSELEKEIEGIIKQFCIHNGIERYEEKVGNLDEIIRKCGKNFFLLNELLRVWKKKHKQLLLSEVPLDEVYNEFYIRELYYKNIDRNSLLASLCAIYQFDFPIAFEFLDGKGLKVYRTKWQKILQELKDEGLVYLIPINGKNYYSIHEHPFYAEMVLRTLEYKGQLMTLEGIVEKNRENFTVEICKKYLARTEDLRLLHSIYQHREIEIGRRIIEDETSSGIIQHFLARIDNPGVFLTFLNLLNKFGITDTRKKQVLTSDSLRKLCDKISGPKLLNSLLEQLYKFEPKKKEEFLNLLGEDKLIKIYKEKASELTIDTIFDLMKYTNKEVANKVLYSLTEEELKNIFSRSKLSGLYNFFINIDLPEFSRQHPFIKAWKEFLNEKHKKELEELMNWFLSESLSETAKFIRITFFHSQFQEIYRALFFNKNFLTSKLKKANLRDIEELLINIIPIRYKKYPRIGIELANVIFDFYIFPLTRSLIKAEELIFLKRVHRISDSLFQVDGYHGRYSVELEGMVAKCSCPRYKSESTCSHSLAVLLLTTKKNYRDLLKGKIMEASLRDLQRLFQLAYEMENKSLLEDLLCLIEEPQFDLRGKCNEAQLSDINYFLWRIPPQNLSKYSKFMTENVNLVKKMEESSMEEIIILLWNLYQGDSLSPQLFNEEKLIRRLREEINVGRKIALIGLLSYIKPDLIKEVCSDGFKQRVIDSKNEVRRWLLNRRKRRGKGLKFHPLRELLSTFLFLFGINGLKKIDETYCFSVLNTLTPQFDIKKLVYQLRKDWEIIEKYGLANEKRKRLFEENINWLIKENY